MYLVCDCHMLGSCMLLARLHWHGRGLPLMRATLERRQVVSCIRTLQQHVLTLASALH
jgi:hypothetical protein